MTVKNKKILIIIGGGIAAYKSLDLIRLLKKNNNDVKTILTKRKDNISLCSILFSAYSVEVKKSEFKIPAFNQLFI